MVNKLFSYQQSLKQAPHHQTSEKMPRFSKPRMNKEEGDVTNVGLPWAKGKSDCLLCLLISDYKGLALSWCAFETVQQIMKKKYFSTSGQGKAQFQLCFSLFTHVMMCLKTGCWICVKCEKHRAELASDLHCIIDGINLP